MNVSLKCRDSGELPLKNDDFLLKNGRLFCDSRYCSEHGKLTTDWSLALKGDVAALIAANFSAVKLDNPSCGAGSDMQGYYDLVKKTSPRAIVIENWFQFSVSMFGLNVLFCA